MVLELYIDLYLVIHSSGDGFFYLQIRNSGYLLVYFVKKIRNIT